MNIANKLTVLRLIAIPFFVIAFLLHQFSLAGWIFIFASVTDYLDGYLARKLNLVTDFGKFADPLADKILVITALVLMVETLNVPGWIVSVIIARELTITGLRLLLVQKNIVLAADWSGKIKTVTQMFAIIAILFFDFQWSIPIGNILLYISLALTIYSGYDYIDKNKDIFKML